MQKKLIALAVAAAVAAPMAASAAPTIYGKIHASVDYADDDDDGDSSDPVTGVFRASRLGFKGSENLGGSLKAIWQVETQINTSDNSDTGGDFDLRNTFVGLNGKWGTVLLGRHDTPYKIATGKLDSMADRVSDYNNIIGFTSGSQRPIFDERAPQTAVYITPTWNGFHAAAAYIEHKFNEEKTSGQTFTCRPATTAALFPTDECKNDDDNRAISLMAMWESGPWFASGAWERHEGANFLRITGQQPSPGSVNEILGIQTERDQSLGDDYIDGFKAGFGFKFGNSKIALVGEYINDDWDDSNNERGAAYGAFSHKFGNNVVKLGVGWADDSEAESCSRGNDGYGLGEEDCDDGAVNYSVALDHNFSKRTTIYGAFTYVDNDDDGLYGINQGQQIGDGYGAKRPGDDPYALSLGIIHKF